jgi:phage terminase large subunit-like protein
VTTTPLAIARARFAPRPDDDKPRHEAAGWRRHARPEQLPPDGDWDVWYVRGGRGGGKTWTCANAFAELILDNPPGEWGVIAPTLSDVRTTCMESDESGLIKALGGLCGPGGELLEHGPHISRWNRSACELYLRNGSVIFGDGGDDGALRIQGKNLRGCWADELGLWKKWKTAWDESIGFAVRKHPAKIIASGTPKRGMPAIVLVKQLLAAAKEQPDGSVRTTLLRTVDNIANLAGAALNRMRLLQGTALGRQELEGEVLDEAEGALWTRDPEKAQANGLGLIVNQPSINMGILSRRVVALDPADGTEEGDKVGYCVAGISLDGLLYVLASGEVSVGPQAQVDLMRRLYDQWQCDRVILEKNYGQAYARELFNVLDPHLPVKTVSATQGKRTRAEPVAALYARPGVVHVGPGHEILEDQQTSYGGAPGEVSPGALDAMVWALTELGLSNGHATSGLTPDQDRAAVDAIDFGALPSVSDDELLRMTL